MAGKVRNPMHHALCGCVSCEDVGLKAIKPGIPAPPNVKPTNPKDAIGVTKPPSSTLSQAVTAELGVAMLEGACKYGRHNYRVIGVRASVYYDATRRHLDKWWEGEDDDPDSGLSHITKAMSSLAVLRDAMIQSKLNDDRPPATPLSFWKKLEEVTKAVLAKYPDPVAPYLKESE
jgi:hypothetical protein